MHLKTLRKYTIFLFSITALGSFCYALFVPHSHTTSIITSIKQAQKVFEAATPSDLFVFDIDFTIMQPTDPVFQMKNTWPSALNGSFTPTQLALIPLFNDLFTKLAAQGNVEKMYKTFKNSPAEQETLSFLNDLRSRGVPVICLTARKGTEKKLTAREIHDLDINLASSFPRVKNMNFDCLDHFALKSVIPGDVCYYNGILFADSVPKGIVLTEFFKKTGCRPARVFFFDDHRKNSYSITTSMRKLGIPSHCFAYFAKRMYTNSTIDLAVVEKQFAYIKKNARFIGYEEAKTL